MEQRNTKTAASQQERNFPGKWVRLIKPLAILGVVLIGYSFTACKKKNTDSNTPNVFPGLSNKVILDWNVAALAALDAPNYQHVLFASRTLAMVHIAQYDALNSIKPVYKKYCSTSADADANPIAAAANAAYTVLVQLFPDKKLILDSQLAKSIDTIADRNARQKGMALGLQCGNAIINLRKDDGSSQDPVGIVAASTVPGVYQTVPPFNFVFAPFWQTMKPFGLLRPEQFRSAPNPTLQSATYKKDFTEVKTLGEKNSVQRTEEQTIYAKFWYEYAEIGWNRIAAVSAAQAKTDLLTTSRLFAMLNITLTDSYTAGWDSKFHYNFWRPYTAIVNTPVNEGGKPGWEPLLPTPPVQDYPSTHSILGNAGATVLTYFFGPNYAFTTSSTSAATPGAQRSFNGFFSAADENANSRVMAGLHFRFSCTAGQEMGNRIGKWMIENTLIRANQ